MALRMIIMLVDEGASKMSVLFLPSRTPLTVFPDEHGINGPDRRRVGVS